MFYSYFGNHQTRNSALSYKHRVPFFHTCARVSNKTIGSGLIVTSLTLSEA